jgi:phage terminase small subunit
MPRITDEQVRETHARGLTDAEAAKEIGCSRQSYNVRRNKLGLPALSGGGRPKTAKKKPKRKPTLKQERFVTAYMEHGNAARAAKEAGYECKSVERYGELGHEIKNSAGVKAIIERRRKRMEDAGVMNLQEALARVSMMASAQLDDFCEWDDGKLLLKPNAEIPDEFKPCVKSIKRVPVKDAGERVEIELHDQQAALDKIIKHHGGYKNDAPLVPIQINISGLDE